jgi:uncharacterized damage-inducible protein DinB
MNDYWGVGDMVETLRRMYRYQDWAMEQLWPVLEGLTAEELDAPGCSGNGSIRATLTHLSRVQNGWFLWFDGTLSAADAQSMRKKGDDFATMADARAGWREASDRAVACVARLSDADVAKVWTAQRPGGQTLSLRLGEMMLHVANHGTHTRAQIAAAVRRQGKDPGVLEYMKFAILDPA